MELFSWKILSALVTLDGKNEFSMERLRLQKPGNSKPSILITLMYLIIRLWQLWLNNEDYKGRNGVFYFIYDRTFTSLNKSNWRPQLYTILDNRYESVKTILLYLLRHNTSIRGCKQLKFL